MKLLDTTFLAHYYRGTDRVAEYLSSHDDTEDLCTTTINIKEIAVGLSAIDADPTPEQFDAELGWLRIVPFETRHAVEAAALEAELPEKENQDKINSLPGDLLIGGAARALDATVVTDNVADFEFLGVPVESY